MPQFWFRCSPEPISFSTSPSRRSQLCKTATLPQLWNLRSLLKILHDGYAEISATSQKKNLTELETEFGVKLTLMLGAKREAQTVREREVLMKDFKMDGIHSCWWEGLEELNLQIIALLQEWEKKITHCYKSITEPFKHIESFSENMPSVELWSHRKFFSNFVPLQFSFPCYVTCYLMWLYICIYKRKCKYK